jgi:hypothetical protein
MFHVRVNIIIFYLTSNIPGVARRPNGEWKMIFCSILKVSRRESFAAEGNMDRL